MAAFLSGCGTIENHQAKGHHEPYGGVADDIHPEFGGHGAPGFVALLPFLDIPFSLVGDTVMLPFDFYYQHTHPESLRRVPPNPNPLVGWKPSKVKPDPAIAADYQSYIKQLPADQRQALIGNDYAVRLSEDGKGFHAMEARLILNRTNWTHALIYDKANRRIKVIRYANGHLVP